MKDKFSEYYKLSQTEIDSLWNDGLFIFDTNVLLDFYRFSTDTSKVLYNILQKIKTNNQLWIPHQIGSEFQKDRFKVIDIEKNEYDRLYVYFQNKLPNDVNNFFAAKGNNHPLIDSEKYVVQVKNLGKKIAKSIKRLSKKHPTYEKFDNILDQLTELYDSKCVGDQFSESRLLEIYKEGNERYQKKIPPGYLDSPKTEPERYGDLVLWYQLIEKSKESKRSIIFVTRDIKNDWWELDNNKERKGARRELVREMRDKAGTKFYLYEISYFLELASKKLNVKINEKSTKEVETFEPIGATDQLDVKVAEGYTNFGMGNISTTLSGTVSSTIQNQDNPKVDSVDPGKI